MSDTEHLKTTFQDTEGREWNLRLTVGKALLLKNSLDFDVEQMLDVQNGPLNSLIADSWRLVQILVVLTAEDRKERGVSEEQFLEALTGETLDDATSAFLNGVALSLKKLKRRPFAAVVRQMERGTTLAAEKLVRKVEQAGNQMGRDIDSAIGG